MYYLEIQGLFKDFCHISKTFQDKQSNSNSRAFQYCTNPENRVGDGEEDRERDGKCNE